MFAAAKPLGDIPLIVLTPERGMSAATPAATRRKLEQVRDTGQIALTRASTRGSRRIVSNAGHFIAFDQPDAVVDAVVETLAAASARKGR